MILVDLHHFYKAADDLAAGVHVRFVQPLADLFGKLLHVAEHQAKFRLPGGVVQGGGGLLLQAFQTLTGMPDARLEFVLVQQSIFVRVDQSADAASRRGNLLVDVRGIDILFLIAAQATFELALEGPGILKHLADIGPDGRVQPIQTNRLVRANLFAAVAMPIPPGATVVGIERLVPREPGDPVAIEGVSAAAAFQQPLQQVPGAALLPTGTLAVLGQLFGGCLEQRLADNRGHRDRDLIFRLTGVSRHRMPRLFRPASPGARLTNMGKKPVRNSGGRVTAMTDTDLTGAEHTALNPAALSLTDTARVLSAAQNGEVTVEMLQADVEAGAPTNADGTINLVHYAAWLNMKRSDGDD